MVIPGHYNFGDEELNVQFESQELFFELSLEHGNQVLAVNLVNRKMDGIKVDAVTSSTRPGGSNHLEKDLNFSIQVLTRETSFSPLDFSVAT